VIMTVVNESLEKAKRNTTPTRPNADTPIRRYVLLGETMKRA
jgi:hypothetical protein